MNLPPAEEKSKHEQIIEIVDQIFTSARDLGVSQVVAQDEELDGRHIRINGVDVLNFSSCSYLGLELDPRLKAGVIEASQRYGTQFSSSRAYVSVGLYTELENLLGKIFNQPVIMCPSVTLAHLSNIPVLIGDSDAIILDAQVHECVQTAVQLLKARNITVEVIRHNRMDALEEKIIALKGKHKKIWYMADGVYSMYGDFAPLPELERLLNTYEQFHLYVDDAHGMSWAGKNGSGYVLSQIDFHPRLYLVTSTNKGFAAAGGLLVFPDKDSRRKVRNCGKTLIFSGPIQPPMLGAAIASAKIHLSNEIYTLQKQLQETIRFFNATAKMYDLPLICESSSPINFIGVGKPAVGYSMAKRLLNLGYYINLSAYPSVSYNQTGLRLPLNLHHTKEDIDNVLKTIAEQLPLALSDSNSSMKDIQKAFKLNGNNSKAAKEQVKTDVK
jgi:7-keto-8-aminopelargonate synthetase-like enzyme